MMTQFKKGDRVKCVSNTGSPSNFTVGKTYIVEDTEPSYLRVEGDQLVTCIGDDGRAHGQFSSRWQLATFKIGDRVRVLDNMTPGGHAKNVAVGAITTIIDDCAGYGWMLEGSGMYFYTPEQLELVTHQFKAGDKVRYKRDHTQQYTVKGPKTEYSWNSPYNGEPAVDYTNGGWDRESILELVPQETPKAVTPKFKVGDRVKCLRNTGAPPYFTVGNFYKVAEVTFSKHSPTLVRCWPDECNDYNEKEPVGQYEDAWELAPSKFKVGDRVRFIRNQDGRASGKYGTVADVYAHLNDHYRITVDHPFEGHGFEDRQWNVDGKNLEISPTTLPHIVAAVTNGQPRPSPTPFVHATLASAQTEAERLANKTPGTTFEVYALVSRSVANTRQVVEPAVTKAAA